MKKGVCHIKSVDIVSSYESEGQNHLVLYTDILKVGNSGASVISECAHQLFVTHGAAVIVSFWDLMQESNVANEELRGLISPKSGFPAF